MELILFILSIYIWFKLFSNNGGGGSHGGGGGYGGE